MGRQVERGGDRKKECIRLRECGAYRDKKTSKERGRQDRIRDRYKDVWKGSGRW